MRLGIVLAVLCNGAARGGGGAPPALVPWPAEISFGSGELAVGADFHIALAGRPDARVERAARRLESRLRRQVGLPPPVGVGRVGLEIVCEGPARSALPALGMDESYTLEVTAERAVFRAPEPWGVPARDGRDGDVPAARGTGERGLPGPRGRGPRPAALPLVRPAHRLRTALPAGGGPGAEPRRDGGGEDERPALAPDRRPGLPGGEPALPEAARPGLGRLYYTQEQIKGVISYAADRGIRVVPEFDTPGHTTSWFVGHPELASAPGPYAIERKWGIFEPVMDPTREEVYRFLDAFLGEMAALFPDPHQAPRATTRAPGEPSQVGRSLTRRRRLP